MRRANHPRRLVRGEDDFHAVERSVQKFADAGGIGGDLEIEVGLFRVNRIKSLLHRRVGADAEIGERGQFCFTQPLMECLPQQSERRKENKNA